MRNTIDFYLNYKQIQEAIPFISTMAINLGHCLVELGQAKAAIVFVSGKTHFV
jgi:hypothetical protein